MFFRGSFVCWIRDWGLGSGNGRVGRKGVGIRGWELGMREWGVEMRDWGMGSGEWELEMRNWEWGGIKETGGSLIF